MIARMFENNSYNKNVLYTQCTKNTRCIGASYIPTSFQYF